MDSPPQDSQIRPTHPKPHDFDPLLQRWMLENQVCNGTAPQSLLPSLVLLLHWIDYSALNAMPNETPSWFQVELFDPSWMNYWIVLQLREWYLRSQEISSAVEFSSVIVGCTGFCSGLSASLFIIANKEERSARFWLTKPGPLDLSHSLIRVKPSVRGT